MWLHGHMHVIFSECIILFDTIALHTISEWVNKCCHLQNETIVIDFKYRFLHVVPFYDFVWV